MNGLFFLVAIVVVVVVLFELHSGLYKSKERIYLIKNRKEKDGSFALTQLTLLKRHVLLTLKLRSVVEVVVVVHTLLFLDHMS